jgi:isopentenyl-diphosphate delta-isomerase
MSPALARSPRQDIASGIVIPAIAGDGSLFPMEKMEAHRQGQLHLAISAFVFSGAALLLQRRAEGKYHCAGQWANTCCTHPHWGEDVASAASRRLREEMGIAVPLMETRIVTYRADVGAGLVEHERVHMFVARVDRSQLVVAPDPAEVSETRWVEAEELRADMGRAPERYTPWFRIYVERFPDLRF